jgi:DnaJ family protein C protein 28
MFTMNRWESSVDRAIREAMERGEFDDLPGQGKPLDLGDDPNTPEDMQMAYKIMRDNGIAPDWIAQGKELLGRQTALLKALRAAYQNYRVASADMALWMDADRDWQAAQRKFSDAFERLNKEITSYNLKLPPGVMHRPLVSFRQEVEKLGGRV